MDALWAYPWYGAAVVFVAAFGLLSFPALFFVVAPYGRHARAGWGPTIPARWAWLLMEAPSPIGFLVTFLAAGGHGSARWALAGLWLLHYGYRAFVYPFLLKGGDKGKPLLTTGLAFGFNVANGPMNAFAIAALAPHLDAGWTPRFAIGVVLFGVGFAAHQHSDHVLRTLRAPGEIGYKVPNRGLHRYVAAPNYFGEWVQWTGFALAAGTLPAAVFAAFTFANLFPRALSHRRWYRETFVGYPKERRAFFPFVL